jgi:hypothetical protein
MVGFLLRLRRNHQHDVFSHLVLLTGNVRLRSPSTNSRENLFKADTPLRLATDAVVAEWDDAAVASHEVLIVDWQPTGGIPETIKTVQHAHAMLDVVVPQEFAIRDLARYAPGWKGVARKMPLVYSQLLRRAPTRSPTSAPVEPFVVISHREAPFIICKSTPISKHSRSSRWI